jgi:hypothetical protein
MGFALDATSGQGACRPIGSPGIQRRNGRMFGSCRGGRDQRAARDHPLHCNSKDSSTRRVDRWQGNAKNFLKKPLDRRERSEL